MQTTGRGASRQALVVPSLSAATLLFAGCVPLDAPDPVPPQIPSVSSMRSASAIPTGWEDCQDPVATAGEALVEGRKVFAVMAVDTGPGGISGTTLLDGTYSPVITFEDEGPQDMARFTGKIGEDTGFAARRAGRFPHGLGSGRILPKGLRRPIVDGSARDPRWPRKGQDHGPPKEQAGPSGPWPSGPVRGIGPHRLPGGRSSRTVPCKHLGIAIAGAQRGGHW